jgi:predicted NAD-dependent protein-ADP-ribosyltransferase YbiA (DUF1768 family)
MRLLVKKDLLILAPKTDQECAELDTWKTDHAGHVFQVRAKGRGLVFADLGPKEEACREPFNVSSTSRHPAGRWISNFAPTPFQLDGRDYACVEAFWQGLKFENESERRRLAALDGRAAKRAGEEKGYAQTIAYQGQTIFVGTWDHWRLMERACWAKFRQHDQARAALLSTGKRPLEHRAAPRQPNHPGRDHGRHLDAHSPNAAG